MKQTNSFWSISELDDIFPELKEGLQKGIDANANLSNILYHMGCIMRTRAYIDTFMATSNICRVPEIELNHTNLRKIDTTVIRVDDMYILCQYPNDHTRCLEPIYVVLSDYHIDDSDIVRMCNNI